MTGKAWEKVIELQNYKSIHSLPRPEHDPSCGQAQTRWILTYYLTLIIHFIFIN